MIRIIYSEAFRRGWYIGAHSEATRQLLRRYPDAPIEMIQLAAERNTRRLWLEKVLIDV